MALGLQELTQHPVFDLVFDLLPDLRQRLSNLANIQNGGKKLKIKFDMLVQKGGNQRPERIFKEFSDLVDSVKKIRSEVLARLSLAELEHLKNMGAVSMMQAAASEAWLSYCHKSAEHANKAGAEAAETFQSLSMSLDSLDPESQQHLFNEAAEAAARLVFNLRDDHDSHEAAAPPAGSLAADSEAHHHHHQTAIEVNNRALFPDVPVDFSASML